LLAHRYWQSRPHLAPACLLLAWWGSIACLPPIRRPLSRGPVRRSRGLCRLFPIPSGTGPGADDLRLGPLDQVQIPLQAGVLFGTRAADGFITLSVRTYTRFLNAITPGTFREEDGRIADLEQLKIFKEGAAISDRNLGWLNFWACVGWSPNNATSNFPATFSSPIPTARCGP